MLTAILCRALSSPPRNRGRSKPDLHWRAGGGLLAATSMEAHNLSGTSPRRACGAPDPRAPLHPEGYERFQDLADRMRRVS